LPTGGEVNRRPPSSAKSLAKAGKLKVAFKLAFTPTGGKQRVVNKHLTLVKK
jgi:hypothetical protein